MPACLTSAASRRHSIGVSFTSRPAIVDPPRREIDLQLADRERRLGRAAGARGAVAQRHAEPRHQLAHAERLHQVVVGTGVERGDLVLLARARRQDEDRDLRPLAQAPDDLRTVEVRQPEIEDHDVGLARRRLDQPALAGLRLEYFEALAGSTVREEPADLRIVLETTTTR